MVLIIVLLGLMVVILNDYHTTVFEVFSQTASNVGQSTSFALAVSGAAGAWFAVSINAMDFTRTMKKSPNYNKQRFLKRNFGFVLTFIWWAYHLGYYGYRYWNGFRYNNWNMQSN